MACPHDAVIEDALEDQYVCTACGLVLRERPSLCTQDRRTEPATLPARTRACLLDMARRLAVPDVHMLRAARLASEAGATCRHPASLAACLVVAGSLSVRSAERVLGIPHRAMTRAVSRLVRRKI